MSRSHRRVGVVQNTGAVAKNSEPDAFTVVDTFETQMGSKVVLSVNLSALPSTTLRLIHQSGQCKHVHREDWVERKRLQSPADRTHAAEQRHFPFVVFASGVVKHMAMDFVGGIQRSNFITGSLDEFC